VSITKVRDRIKDASLRGNFSLDENIHLTLVFLGECDVQQLDIIKEVMEDTHFAELTLIPDKVGYFKRDSGNTWWIGLKENQLLSDLQADLTRRLQQKGFMLENRKYVPHITIGREVKMRTGFVYPEVSKVSFNITSIELMKSERINGKLTYTSVHSIAAVYK